MKKILWWMIMKIVQDFCTSIQDFKFLNKTTYILVSLYLILITTIIRFICLLHLFSLECHKNKIFINTLTAKILRRFCYNWFTFMVGVCEALCGNDEYWDCGWGGCWSPWDICWNICCWFCCCWLDVYKISMIPQPVKRT